MSTGCVVSRHLKDYTFFAKRSGECTRWPFTLFPTSRWHQNKSPVLVGDLCTKTQPLFWCKWEIGNNLNGHPVQVSWKIKLTCYHPCRDSWRWSCTGNWCLSQRSSACYPSSQSGIFSSSFFIVVEKHATISVAIWHNLIPSFPWIAPGWRAGEGCNPMRGRDQILQCSSAEP